MLSERWRLARWGKAAIVICWLWPGSVLSADRIPVVTSFSVLADMVTAVGGDRVSVFSLVGPNEDTHVYVPKPKAVKELAKAELFFVNGLGLEGWLLRLMQAARTDARLITVSDGARGW